MTGMVDNLRSTLVLFALLFTSRTTMLSKTEIFQTLRTPVSLDAYLLDIAKREKNHQFLGKATQGAYLALIQLLKRYFETKERAPSDIRVLDWGTGKGHISYLLKKAGFSVTSCDLKASAVDSTFGQKTPIITEQSIEVTPLTHPSILPFAEQTFDLVVSFGVLEHTQNDLASLTEIRRILKPSGVFFFCFLPYWLSWTQRLAHLRNNFYHDRLYKIRTMQQLAAETGFSVENIWHGQLFPKNSIPYYDFIEKIDRLLTSHTPFQYFATNLEGFLIAE